MPERSTSSGLSFDLFRESYKPHIRAKGYEQKLKCAFEMDAHFFEEFRYLRRYLLADQNNWGEDIIRNLSRHDALKDAFDHEDAKVLHRLYRVHSGVFRSGKFGTDYLDSIETIALFYIYHDVQTIWIVGAYQEQTERLIDLIFKRATSNKRLPVRETMRALTRALTLEINQIQRTYTMYERHVGAALVSDLQMTSLVAQAAIDVVGSADTRHPDTTPPDQ